MAFDQFCCFLSSHAGECSCDHKCKICQHIVTICCLKACHIDTVLLHSLQDPQTDRITKISIDGFCTDLANIIDLDQFFRLCLCYRIDRTKIVQKRFCRCFANPRYAQSCQKAVGIILLGCLDHSEKFICIFFFAQDTLFDQFVPVFIESINIRNVVQIVLMDEFLNIGCAKSLDIHGIAPHKIDDMAFQLCRTGRRRTLDIFRVFFPIGRRSTHRALIRDHKGLYPCRTFVM